MKENPTKRKLSAVLALKTRSRIEIMECCFAHTMKKGYKMPLHVIVNAYIVGGKITKCLCDEEKLVRCSSCENRMMFLSESKIMRGHGTE